MVIFFTFYRNFILSYLSLPDTCGIKNVTVNVNVVERVKTLLLTAVFLFVTNIIAKIEIEIEARNFKI